MALTKAMSLWSLSSDELFMQTFVLAVHIQMMLNIKNVCKYDGSKLLKSIRLTKLKALMTDRKKF